VELVEYEISEYERFIGELELELRHDGTQYSLRFEYLETAEPPEPFLSEPTKEIEMYAWPTEHIPEELCCDISTADGKAAALSEDRLPGDHLPDEINLIARPYDEAGTQRSPFIISTDP